MLNLLNKKKVGFGMSFIAIAVLFLVQLVAGASSSTFNVQYTQPGFQSSYRSYYSQSLGQGLPSMSSVFWPGLADAEKCEARQDFIISIAPAGCQPIVRSDLLAEQNVPVFCQLNALKLNPLVEVNAISHITPSMKTYPKEIAGVGFHPAKAALRTRTTLLGSPVINDVGYVVVVLKKMNEKDMPKWVGGNLSAYIRYDIERAYGIGRHEFFLPVLTDEQWEFEYKKYSFWDGKGFLRLDYVEPEKASVSIYSSVGGKYTGRVAKLDSEKGKLSRAAYLPGFFCRAALQVQLNGVGVAETFAKLRIDDDVVELVKGGKFLNNKCSIVDIKNEGSFGEVTISCPRGREVLKLKMSDVKLEIDGKEDSYAVGDKIGEKYLAYAGELPKAVTNTERFFIVLSKEYNDKIKKEIQTIMKTQLKKETSLNDFKKLFIKYRESGYDIIPKGTEAIDKIMFVDFSKKDITLDKNIKKQFDEAVLTYEKTAEKYPSEKEPSENFFFVGEEALLKAEELALNLQMKETYAKLLEKHASFYSDTESGKKAKEKLAYLGSANTEKASSVVFIDEIAHNVDLLEIREPSLEDASVEITYYNKDDASKKVAETAYYKKNEYIRERDVGKGHVQLVDFNENEAEISYDCTYSIDNKDKNEKGRKKVKEGESLSFCNERVFIKKINMKKYARVSLIPKAYNQESWVNFSFKIGIEKRSIKLSTEKTKEMIANLDESIKKFEGIVKNLGNFVSTMKGACLGTSAVLIAKNLITGFSGEATARKAVMQMYRQKCSEETAKGEHDGNMDVCYSKKSPDIDKDVKVWTELMKKENERIGGWEKGMSSKPFLGESVVDTKRSKEEYCKRLIEISQKGVYDKAGKPTNITTKEVFDELGKGVEKGESICTQRDFTYDEMKRITMASEILKSGASKEMKDYYEKDLGNTLVSLKERNAIDTGARDLSERLGMGVKSYKDPNKKTQTYEVGSTRVEELASKIAPNGKIVYSDIATKGKQYAEITTMPGGKKAMHILQSSDGKTFDIEKSYEIDVTSENKINILGEYKQPVYLSYMRFDETTYKNKYLNPKVKYFSVDPYKDMPAIVPFSRQDGWYAAVKQTLPIFGNARGYDKSGRVSTFWVCNVGKNGLEQFNEGMGDDVCKQINIDAGQPLNVFPGLKPEKAKQIHEQAISALEQASTQAGKREVKIGNDKFPAEPTANIPEIECQSMMSASDCNILFNVCDPVICPVSRCNLGGSFYVSNVIQSGIFGSTFLCLPNFGNPFEGKVAIPFCITGIHAGLDAYTQILKQHRSCLNESLATGNYVGICDQITAVYKCEFFWRQMAPMMNQLIPRIIQWAHGAGTRGGGEYASVGDAWKNAEDSVAYFRDFYGKNSLNAFKYKSIDEAGTDLCKAFVSTGYPKSFKTMLEPDSPAQFTAWFDEIPYTTATVPPTSHYKVFFNIYAGKERGEYYSIYLKRQDNTPFYDTPLYYVVENGFVGKENSVTKSKDFTAPAGYKELCVRVGLQEECGFKKVSTSFALNYMRDKYVQGQIQDVNIETEEDCVSGTRSLGVLATPASLGSYGEQALIPELEKRGVVRICSTLNPGKGVDETRWQRVGKCNTDAVGCWLDKKSVEKSITAGDIGVLNDTLKNLESVSLKEKTSLNAVDSVKAINMLNEKISSIQGDSIYEGVIEPERVAEIILLAEMIESKAVFSPYKARALFLKASVYDILARDLWANSEAKKISAVTGAGGASMVGSEGKKECYTEGGGVCTTITECKTSVLDYSCPAEQVCCKTDDAIAGETESAGGSIIMDKEDELTKLMEKIQKDPKKYLFKISSTSTKEVLYFYLNLDDKKLRELFKSAPDSTLEGVLSSGFLPKDFKWSTFYSVSSTNLQYVLIIINKKIETARMGELKNILLEYREVSLASSTPLP